MRHLLLQAQAWWDAQRFDQPEWRVTEWRDQKVRHIQLHVAKALGKVVAALDTGTGAASGADSMRRVRDEVLPDVAIYRSQLINTFADCCTAPASSHHAGTTVTIRPAAAPPGTHAPRDALLFYVVLWLSRASAILAAYIEPREHGVESPVSHLQEAIQNLHDSATVLAAHFEIDLVQAHRARLEALLGATLPPSSVERES